MWQSFAMRLCLCPLRLEQNGSPNGGRNSGTLNTMLLPFALGLSETQLWLRIKSFDTRSALSLDLPLRCVLFLTVSAGLIFLLARRADALSSLRFQGPEGVAVGLFWMYCESLLVLLTLNPLVLGEYPQNAHAPSLLIRLRRWLFLAIKIVLLPPILFLATAAVARIFPPAAGILFVGLIFGLRWVLADQRRRCPVCLHFLANPVELDGHTHMVFQPHGTELTCARGHGSLYVPDAPTSWCQKQRWQYMSISPSGGRRG